jgi:hypothetical protein
MESDSPSLQLSDLGDGAKPGAREWTSGLKGIATKMCYGMVSNLDRQEGGGLDVMVM